MKKRRPHHRMKRRREQSFERVRGLFKRWRWRLARREANAILRMLKAAGVVVDGTEGRK